MFQILPQIVGGLVLAAILLFILAWCEGVFSYAKKQRKR